MFCFLIFLLWWCICMKKLRDELTRALMEANDGNVNEGAGSFNELVKEMTSKQDLKAFAFKIKGMVYKKFTMFTFASYSYDVSFSLSLLFRFILMLINNQAQIFTKCLSQHTYCLGWVSVHSSGVQLKRSQRNWADKHAIVVHQNTDICKIKQKKRKERKLI